MTNVYKKLIKCYNNSQKYQKSAKKLKRVIKHASTAEESGLLNYVFEDKDNLNAETENWIQEHILPKSASSLRYSVRSGRIVLNRVFKKNLKKLEKIFIKELMETDDANEGINSFMEKRIPVWKNS